VLAEDQEQGEDELAEEAFAGRTAEEGADLGLDAVGDRRAEPIAQGRTRDGVLLGVAALRGMGTKRVAEVGVGLGAVQAAESSGQGLGAGGAGG
jgi:hypothetical protein